MTVLLSVLAVLAWVSLGEWLLPDTLWFQHGKRPPMDREFYTLAMAEQRWRMGLPEGSNPPAPAFLKCPAPVKIPKS